MVIASIPLHLPVQDVVPVRLSSSKNSLLSRLVERMAFVEERLRTFAREHPFMEVLKNRALRIQGCIRVAGCIILVLDFIKRVCVLSRIACTDLSENRNRLQLVVEGKQTFISLAAFSSMTASLLQWADSIRIVALGKLAPFLQKFIYGATLVTSGFGIEKMIHVLKKEEAELAKEQNPAVRDLHRHRHGLAVLDLAYHISTVAWAVLGLIEMIGGIAFSPLLSGSLLVISSGLILASLVYSLYIEFNLAPLAAPRAPDRVPLGEIA